MDEMKMVKFEILVEEINKMIRKRNVFLSSIKSLAMPLKQMSLRNEHNSAEIKESITPLHMIFDSTKLNEFALVICNVANFTLSESSDTTAVDPWEKKYNTKSLKDSKTRIEAAKDFVKYCKLKQNRPEAYKFIFWSLMIISVESETSDEWLSLICDFAHMLRLTDEELLDITYVIKSIFNEVEEEYVFKTKSVPSILDIRSLWQQ